jgi:hypothetical protein
MQSPHYPQVAKRNDGSWVLNCRECQRDTYNSSVPIGIGIPLESEDTARRLQENHVGTARRLRRS